MWLGLATWKLTLVPGMSMDEAWSIVSARGQWPPANPLSGMSSYTGRFPVALLKLFGTSSGLLVLRGASVLASGTMLVLIGLMLRRLYPARLLRGWALPLIATCPVWLVTLRTGIEVTMFTPALTVLGLYLYTLRTRGGAVAAGVAWGLLVYNHLLGLWALVSLWLAWLVTYRRLLPSSWRPLLVGFSVGLLPRLVALALYDDKQITDLVQAHSTRAALADLRWLPQIFWETLTGTTVYLRYVGRLSKEIQPYWLLAPLMLIPWMRHLRSVPKVAWFMLSAVVSFGVLATVGAPYMGVRFFVLPAVGLCAFFVLLGAAAVERDGRWAYPVRAVAGALVLGNLYYLLNNFYLPWHDRDLGIRSFFLGERSPRMGSWVYLPKGELVSALRQLDPAPEQILAPPSLSRPLQALIDVEQTGIRVTSSDQADRSLRSVFVDYRMGRVPARHCIRASDGRMCFKRPVVVDNYFVVYR